MKILVFGAGALGSLVGALLSDKNDVTLLCRKAHAEAIRKKGLKVTGLESFTARPAVVTDIGMVKGKPELIILTVKSYDTASAGRMIIRKYPEDIPVLSLQNGLGNLDELSKLMGKGRVIGGLTSHGVTFKGSGWVHHAGTGDTVLGELAGKKSAMVDEISKMFCAAGFKNRVTDNIAGEVWAKVIVNAGINPLTAIASLENGYLLKCKELETIMELACEEGIAVAKASGARLPDADLVEKTKNVARLTAKNKSSMLQDILKGKRTEIDSISGAIARLGKQHNVKTPVNATLAAIVRAFERRSGTC